MSRALQAACYGKVRYETRVDAQRADARKRPYQCYACGGWHHASRKSSRKVPR